MGQAQINVRTRACSRTSIARTKQAALTHIVRGKELRLHSIEFLRVLTAARQQWTLDSDSELYFDGFVTVEFGENGHFAANLAPQTMWIDVFFFLTGMSDVNSDSSDVDSAFVAMSLTATML